jgi:hypothetical protein
MPTADANAHLARGTATLALFCAGFATFALRYCVQPLLPLPMLVVLAALFIAAGVSAGNL